MKLEYASFMIGGAALCMIGIVFGYAMGHSTQALINENIRFELDKCEMREGFYLEKYNEQILLGEKYVE